MAAFRHCLFAIPHDIHIILPLFTPTPRDIVVPPAHIGREDDRRPRGRPGKPVAPKQGKENVFRKVLRPTVSAVTILSMIAIQATPLLSARAAEAARTANVAALAPGRGITREDYEACQARDEVGFKAAVETITRRALRNGLATVDYDAAVGDAWRRRGLQQIIEVEVDRVIENVRKESSWTKLLKSLASKETAKELATTVATRVYRSDKVKKAIEALAVDVGTSVGKRIELATVDAAEPARKCMQAFLGARFGQTVARVVSTDAGNKLELDSNKAGAKVSTGSVILQSSGGIAGVMVLIVRRQLAKIASRVGQRVIGAVLSRLVSVVAGGIGVVLIAKDIWDMRNGVLPIISDEMKAKATMRKVRREIAKETSKQMSLNIDDLGSKSAEQVVAIWREFRQAHAKVLNLAERHASFKAFLNNVPAAKMARLDEVVAITLASENEEGLLKRLANGTLDDAVKRLSPAGMQVARDTRSLKRAFAWQALAGDKLPKVLTYDIHRHAKPNDFTKQGLLKILALDDPLAIGRVSALKRDARTALFELPAKDLTALARALPQAQLSALSGYLTSLERPAAQRMLFAVATDPRKMQSLSKPRVRSALLGSNDQLAAVDLMVRSGSTLDVVDFINDLSLLRHLQVSPWLILERYPGWLSALGIAALLLLLILWRLIVGRRPKVIVQMPPGHEQSGQSAAAPPAAKTTGTTA